VTLTFEFKIVLPLTQNNSRTEPSITSGSWVNKPRKVRQMDIIQSII